MIRQGMYRITCYGPSGSRSKEEPFENFEEAKRGAMRLLRDNDITIEIIGQEGKMISRDKFMRGKDSFGKEKWKWDDWNDTGKEIANGGA